MTTVEFQATANDGVIEIPPGYRDRVTGRVRVILLTDETPAVKANMIDVLLAHPVEVEGFTPLSREEAHAR